MSRILVVTPYTLDPPLGGGKMAVLYRCAALAREHRLFLLTGGPSAGAAPALGEIFEQAWHAPYCYRGGHPLINQALRTLTSSQPFCSSFLDEAAGRQMARIIAEQQIEIVLIEHFYSALRLLPFLPKSGSLRIGVIEQNVEHHVWRDQAQFPQIRLPVRMLSGIEAGRLRRSLPQVYRGIDGVAFISGRDREQVAKICVHPNTHTCECILPPQAVRKAQFQPTGRLCYWGSFGYFPNLEGMMWFAREVWPRVCAAQPGAELLIFEDLGTRRVRHALADLEHAPGITITGRIPNEEMNRLACGCDGFVSPVRLGSGVKLKNLVAMALGLPIVATASSMAGNLAEPGRDFLLADTPTDFAARILELNSSERQRTLGANVLAAFDRHYTAEAATPGWLRFIESLRTARSR